MWRRVFLGSPDWRLVAVVVAATALLAWLAARTAQRLATQAMRSLLRDAITPASPIVRAPLRLIGLGTFALVFFVLIFPAFEAVELRPRTGLELRTLSAWAFHSGLKVLLVAVVAFAVIR